MKKNKKIMAGLVALILVAGFVAISCAGLRRGDVPFGSSYDVVIIGAGGAGLSAAITVKDAGASVVIFEQMPFPGGNTVRATGGINATGTEFQARLGINDTVDLFFDDVMRGGGNMSNPVLVRILAEQSASAIHWLTAMGADLSDVGRMGGSSINRTHRPTGGAQVGPELSGALVRRVGEMNIPLITEAQVTSLTTARDGRVNGVEVRFANRTHRVRANSVILATGGFGANSEMIESLDPSLRGFVTTNHAGADGSGIMMAESLGAALIDMREIQTHPTHAPGREMITEAVRGNGAIMTNTSGRRFVNEMDLRDIVSEAILAQDGGGAFLVFDYSIRRSLAVIESYIRSGIVLEGATPEALAPQLGASGAVLAETIARYNAAVAAGTDADFGRASMPRSLSVPPFYAIWVKPAIHHTMGGVKIDTEARVICVGGLPIPGLYAAGEVAGGFHGNNRLGGMALADIIVFGRIAGESAVAGR